jgi:hypothetical protein
VIDPVKQTGWQYDKGGEPVHLDGDGVLKVRAEERDAMVRLNELFAELPK